MSENKNLELENLINNDLSKIEYLNSNELFNVKLYAYFFGFFLGLFYLINIPIYYIEKDKLLLSASTMNIFSSIIDWPYSIKPSIAFTIDKIKLKYGFKKIIIVLSVIDIFVLFFIYYSNLNFLFFLIFLIIHQLIIVTQLIIAETIIIIISKRIDKKISDDNSSSLLSSFFICRNTGILIGTFFSGRLIKKFGTHFVIFLNSLFSFLILNITYFFNEKVLNLDNNNNNNNNNNFFTDIKNVLKIFKDRTIFLLTLFLFILNCCPNYDSDFKNFFTDILKFDEIILSNLATVSLVCSILGLSIYNLLFSKTDYKLFYSITNLILLLLIILNLILVTRSNIKIGINDENFSYLSYSLISFFSELNSIPILCICMDICPKNLEGTTFSLFTSIFNFSISVSLLLGSLFSKFILDTKNYSNFWVLIIIQAIYYLLFMINLLFVKFPKKKIEK